MNSTTLAKASAPEGLTRIGSAVLLGMLALLWTGCSSSQRFYDVTLSQPNPYGATQVRSATKPTLNKQKNYEVTDGRGSIYMIQKAYVTAIQPVSVKKPVQAEERGHYYNVLLATPNPYGTALVRSADKPKLDKEQNYIVTDEQGVAYRVQSAYVTGIQKRETKPGDRGIPQRLDNTPGKKNDPNYINTFEYR
jgi:hypothetical protein